jgi:hypothetical protein
VKSRQIKGIKSVVNEKLQMRRRKMFDVVYYSLSGNTEKVAEEIASKLGTKTIDIKTMDTIPENSLVLLGSGCYGSVNWLNTSSFLWIETSCGEEISSSLPRLHLAGAKSSY